MAEAITDAKKRAASEQLEEVNTKCTGSILVNALWEDTRCSICLSNGRAIDICADGEGLKWHVVEHGARGQQYAHVAQTLWLDFATEEDPYAWDRYEALRKRMGRELKGVSESDFGLHLYVDGLESLLFSVLFIRDAPGKVILFWDDAG